MEVSPGALLGCGTRKAAGEEVRQRDRAEAVSHRHTDASRPGCGLGRRRLASVLPPNRAPNNRFKIMRLIG